MADSNCLVFKMNHRYGEGESPSSLYNHAFEVLSVLQLPWGVQTLHQKEIDNIGSATMAVKYTKVEKSSPIKSFIFGYISRNRSESPPDSPAYDDTLTVEFYPKKVRENWTYLLDEVFVKYILAFKPYFGRLYDAQMHTDDVATFDEEKGETVFNPVYVDWRHGVYRIWQANYWDRDLCQRSFNLSPEDVVHRLSGKVANCRMLDNGALVICSYDILSGVEILKLNEAIFPLLKS